jgi:alkyl hydroperoxide reductase subunit AhpF
MKKITRSAGDGLSAESHGMPVERGTCQKEKAREEPMAIISPEDRQTLQTLFEQEAQGLGITRIPAFILQGHTRGAVRYFGIPAGYEFSTLVEDLIDVSKGTTKLSERTRESLATVDQDLHIQVFVTPT